MEYPGSERENNIILAEYQAYIIDELITRFDEHITWWLVDCGYEVMTVMSRWSEIGDIESHIYDPELVKFARLIAWTHI
ncbi:Uncharacterised protein [Klebsiella michiganensis]|uniref:hypothetical protein n=1 Tax=Klebsiella/Raoultella group TaxID=2890311 RepID=UPI000DFBA08B|nr:MULTISPECIES: hypothetical protein [Klebsiella/Raoultella group]MBA8306133.1 hypothetical protein [Klebsiella michiganensis]MBW5931927.1 hypothetical protein [Klebsiella michiganensis]MBW5933832.1 hypothetical protein [Klebsiella michiganensis]MBX4818582.1 hypothetical protein [Klebsiella michiganensis]QLP35697.1 hypothetical protein HVX57_09480 [Klebsiella michiganensis]